MTLALPKDDVIRSQKYLRGSKDQPCLFRGPTCCDDPETTVPAHMNGAAFGKAGAHKAHDIAIVDACFACHSYIDVGHGTNPLMSDADFYRALLVGVVLTMVNRAKRQIIIVPLDPERLSNDRPTPPRKPKSERRPIAGRSEIPQRAKTAAKAQHTATTPRTKVVGYFPNGDE